MWSERWLEQWRSRTALLCAAVLFVIFLVSAQLSASGQCEHWGFSDGASLPIAYPWQPDTTEGRVVIMRLITVMAITETFSGHLVVWVLVGLIWARVVRSRGIHLALMLVPALALLMKVPALIVYLVEPNFGSNPPLAVELAWEAEFWSRTFARASWLLVATGLVGLALRMIRNRRALPHQT